MANKCKWEAVTASTYRMWVPEGWLVRATGSVSGEFAITFVPDDHHLWVLE